MKKSSVEINLRTEDILYRNSTPLTIRSNPLKDFNYNFIADKLKHQLILNKINYKLENLIEYRDCCSK